MKKRRQKDMTVTPTNQIPPFKGGPYTPSQNHLLMHKGPRRLLPPCLHPHPQLFSSSNYKFLHIFQKQKINKRKQIY